MSYAISKDEEKRIIYIVYNADYKKGDIRKSLDDLKAAYDSSDIRDGISDLRLIHADGKFEDVMALGNWFRENDMPRRRYVAYVAEDGVRRGLVRMAMAFFDEFNMEEYQICSDIEEAEAWIMQQRAGRG